MGWGARYSSTIQNGYRTKTRKTHTQTPHNNQHERRPDSPAALPLCHHDGQGRIAPKHGAAAPLQVGAVTSRLGCARRRRLLCWGAKMAPNQK
jgi:hypothetical protein